MASHSSRVSICRVAIGLILFLCMSVAWSAKEETADTPRAFSFLHVSDSHLETHFTMPDSLDSARSYSCLRTLKDLGPIPLAPYGVTAPKPSFLLLTGDITEFGFGGVTWNVLDAYFEGVDFPIYLVPGNHDNTWVATPQEFRKRFGGLNYSFDIAGCHFIGLCTATLQDPLQSIGPEILEFLEKDLKKVDEVTPVFVYFHHPLAADAYASRYEVDRLIDALRRHNVALILDGHGHSAVTHDYWGIDGVEGGSPFGNKPVNVGFNVVYVDGDRLYVGYQQCGSGGDVKPLLEKVIAGKANYPDVTISEPDPEEEFTDDSIKVKAQIHKPGSPIVKAWYDLDDETSGELQLRKGTNASGEISVTGLMNGAHFLRVTFEDSSGGKFTRSTAFYVDREGVEGQGRALWRYRMKGASKTRPLLIDDRLYVGSMDRGLYALKTKSGSRAWRFESGGEVLSSPAAWNGRILFGTGAGTIYCLNQRGKPQWTHETGAAVFSTPAIDVTGSAYFGTNAAQVLALNIADGSLLWTNSDAQYSVESELAVKICRVYFGAWDGYLYCADAKSGKTLWKVPGPKNQDRLNRYYAPADDGPVVAANGNVYVADRGYVGGSYLPDGQFIESISDDCWAIGTADDGNALYLRSWRKPVSKVDLDGNELWQSEVTAGRFPLSPIERDRKVYVCTNTGLLYVLSAATGKTLWRYRVTPGLYVMAEPAVSEGIVYVADMNGYVTAIAPPEGL